MRITANGNSAIYRISYFVAILFPIFKFSVIPSNYAPLIMLPLVFIGFYSLVVRSCSGSLSGFDLKVIFLYSYPVVVTLFALFNFDYSVHMVDVIKDIAPPVIGLLMIYGFYQLFKSGGFYGFASGILFSSRIVILYGVIEILTLAGFFPEQLRGVVAMLTSGIESGRLQLFTPEASWATMYLAFVFPFFFLGEEISAKDKYFFIPLLITIYLYAFSFQAFFILVFSAFFYFMFFSKNKFVFVTIFIFSIIFCMACVYIIITLLYVGMEDPPYHISRIYKLFEFNGLDFESVLLLDGSVFIRIMLPVYAFVIGLEHLLGVGLVFYPYIFDSSYTTLPYSSLITENAELVNYMIEKKVDPRSFYMSHLISGGLLLFLFFLFFVYEIVRRLDFVSRKFGMNRFSMYVLFYCLGVFFQFGTYAFVPFSFLLGLLIFMEELNEGRS